MSKNPLDPEFDPSKLQHPDRGVYLNQEKFLSVYRECGNDARAWKLSGIAPRTLYYWKAEDRLSFLTRYGQAFAEFCSWLENKAIELVSDMKITNSPLLLITLLNANLPDKYKPGGAVTIDQARDLLAELRKQSRPNRKTVRELLESPEES